MSYFQDSGRDIIYQKALDSVVSNQIGMKFGRNVLHVKVLRLTESDFCVSQATAL